MCQITTIMSGAISLGVLAGVLSGIVYVVLVGLKWVGKLRLSLEEEGIRGRREETFVVERSLCRKCRSEPDEECCECSGGLCVKPEYHIRNRHSRRISENWSDEKDDTTSQGEDFSDSKTIKIREKIEKLVEEIVGGSLDGVSVGRLSKHSNYLAMFAKHHEPLCHGLTRLGYALHLSHLNRNGVEETPKEAHATLKSLIEKVVAEAMKLPNIEEILHAQNSLEEIGSDSDFTNKCYEDILATAILNKVIEQCQNRCELIGAKKYKKSNTRNMKRRNDNHFNHENEENDLCNSDWSDTSKSEQLSLTIEEHIEEITTTYENSEEEELNEEVDYKCAIPFPESGRIILNGDQENSEEECGERSSVTQLITSTNSWEENWLFQRKRLRSRPSAHHPVPVPMLVPNPSQDFRALIGGVDADDLSDMSECSDSELEDIVLADHANEKPEEGKTFQDGQVPDLIMNGNIGVNESAVDEAVSDVTGSPSSLNSESSCPSLSQKERDVTVDYECFQKVDFEVADPPLPRLRDVDLQSPSSEEYVEPMKCRIAEREKEKWNNAVPLADNPYSAENILKREQQKKKEYFRTDHRSKEYVEFGDSLPTTVSDPTYEVYSRDYYIKASRYPTGDPNVRTTPETAASDTSQENSLRNGNEIEEGKIKTYHPVGDIQASKSCATVNRKAVDCWEDGFIRNRIAEKTNITLPNVKELTKKFSKGIEEFSLKPSPSTTNQSSVNGIMEHGKEGEAPPKRESVGKVAERETSKSSLLVNTESSKLSLAQSATSRSNTSIVEPQKAEVESEAVGKMSNDSDSTENTKITDNFENAEKTPGKEVSESREITKSSSVPLSKFTGKEIHSLTARSISKEFREELKYNSSRRNLPRIDRGSSGESDHVDIASEGMRNRSPTPPIDLQSKRKFWEDIISSSNK